MKETKELKTVMVGHHATKVENHWYMQSWERRRKEKKR